MLRSRLLSAGLASLSRRIPAVARSFATGKKAKKSDAVSSERVGGFEGLSLIFNTMGQGPAALQTLLDESNVDVNSQDSDLRSPLHLAAAEGNLEVVKFLVSKGAAVNAVDNFQNSPLNDAVAGRHVDVAKYLVSNGAKFGDVQAANMTLVSLASQSDLAGSQLYFESGADINGTDYDGRTPLHLAAAVGSVEVVDWLLYNGAKIDAVDRFHNTPLQDAERGKGRNFITVAKMLQENGARKESGVKEFSPATIRTSVHEALPFICERGQFVHGDVYLCIREDTEFELLTNFTDRKFVESSAAASSITHTVGHVVVNDKAIPIGRAYHENHPVVINDITSNDFARAEEYKEAGIKGVLVLPFVHKGTVIGSFKFLSQSPISMSADELKAFSNLSSNICIAGIYEPTFNPVQGIDAARMPEIYRRILSEGVFSPAVVYNEVDWFFSMGLPLDYIQIFSTDILANHIHSFIAAKQFAKTTGNQENIWLHIENNEKLLGGRGKEQALLMLPNDHRKIVAAERNIQKRLALIPADKPYSLEAFTSSKPFAPNGSKSLCVYILLTHQYANIKTLGKKETNIWEVASETFLQVKAKPVRERYQKVIKECLTDNRLSPVCHIGEVQPDGLVPLMLAFVSAGVSSASYMLQLTELLQQNGIVLTRKFIETFSNGVIVFSLHIKAGNKNREALDRVTKQFSMLHVVPPSALTPKFLSGEIRSAQYTYASSVARFVYYFINQRSEDYDTLAKVFANDPLNLSRLRTLHTTLKRDAVSQTRIFEALLSNSELHGALFDDFNARCRGQEAPESVDALSRRIKAGCNNELDKQILVAVQTFNRSVLKTNFYKVRKSALSFRLDPTLLFPKGGDWPQTPFGIFFLMGSEFQGFHIRFQDIARGGIRMITSRDLASYNRNLATQFAENYGLAYTQNLKNKDIPEFGSKGTILLNLDQGGSKFLAFQKYISALLDLMLADTDVYDRYGKTELIFCGPDEGTADYMEWAALYARYKNYAYWRSFTTGKPVGMGGIPHDLFGMTTRSVHRVVMGCLGKMGLDESKVTKIQTGGPDGDLGSNEILISKDKTKAIVDGSGVVFDPNGLDRPELERLARARKMIEHFDAAKLGPGGFRVLISDVNVTLPSGEVVENGTAFRNEFHLHPLCTADMFVPCGGRPEAVNLSNVRRLLDKDGKSRFKIIVEGANLFFTQDARMIMEEAGAVLYKDASANKGGVTSSSLEVTAALSLPESVFTANMCVADIKNPPPFYAQYVKEIQDRIENDAGLEFECIWKEHEEGVRQGKRVPRYILTDMVSAKINELNAFITASPLFDNIALRRTVLAAAIPKKLQELVGLDTVLQHMPESYARAIFGAYLSSRYVYKNGIHGNEFSFFQFMQPYLKESK